MYHPLVTTKTKQKAHKMEVHTIGETQKYQGKKLFQVAVVFYYC